MVKGGRAGSNTGPKAVSLRPPPPLAVPLVNLDLPQLRFCSFSRSIGPPAIARLHRCPFARRPSPSCVRDCGRCCRRSLPVGPIPALHPFRHRPLRGPRTTTVERRPHLTSPHLPHLKVTPSLTASHDHHRLQRNQHAASLPQPALRRVTRLASLPRFPRREGARRSSQLG